MACVDLTYISNEECIGNSLSSINGNFAALSSAVCDLSASTPDTSINVFDSPTIDLDWNASTRTLSADVSTAVKEASAFNVVDSPTIDLDWNASTRTLSAVTTSMVATSSSQMVAKAWVNFNGTGTIGTNQTIRSSYNVSSVTKNGTGDYTVNFARAMANANYSVVVSSNNNGASITASRAEPMADCIINLSTSSFGYNHREGSGGNLFDVGQSMITIFGN